MSKLSISFKALRELGPGPAFNILRYRFGLKMGWYRRRTLPGRPYSGRAAPLDFLATAGEPTPPGNETLDRVDALLQGQVEIFGGLRQPLDFSVPVKLRHWTGHETSQVAGRDVKFFWEPARFCWTADLVRVFRWNADPRLPEFFASQVEAFMAANPPYDGPHWANGQEVGLRFMNLVLAYSVFGDRITGLPAVLAAHAARIPPTLVYARAQRNNHLLSEAAALFTAGLALPDHPQAEVWRRLGLTWFCRGILDQFSADGVYMQQSLNYHRLALQLALWVDAAAGPTGLPPDVRHRLAAGGRHLIAYCDPDTGNVPNLGANDGAYIFPLTGRPFADFRPVLQAAARAFVGAPAFPPGPWDDMSAWFGLGIGGDATVYEPPESDRLVLLHPRLDSRAFLRSAVFSHRPGHADQLHVDLWWRGLNLAADPGTFQYNADPPWDNPLVSAHFHNTLTVDGLDQMTRAGRFLYVDRAQARTLVRSAGRVIAEHDGYRSLGLQHRRTLSAAPGGWRVEDVLEGHAGHAHRVRVHWLLPDLPWRLEGSAICLESGYGPVLLDIRLPETDGYCVQLVRGGTVLVGPADSSPAAGWFSPAYGVKVAALSFAVEFESRLPVRLESCWELPKEP